MNVPSANKDKKYQWDQILVPGELKSNPLRDEGSDARLNIATYAREVLTAQPTRRFLLAFTLCGGDMQLWEFDRLGAIGSNKFDIHKEAQRFVSIVLGFLWMDGKSLGFDPTICPDPTEEPNHPQYINIQRDGTTERFIIDKLISRTKCVSGRATTCWKAYREGDRTKPFVIKDSWQFPEHEEEGKLLRDATELKVKNIARYYAHKTVRVGDNDDDVHSNIRRGLDVSKASNYKNGHPAVVSSIGLKRPASGDGSPLPPSKRACPVLESPTKPGNPPFPNRVHRRVILADYGTPIFAASSPVALLKALKGCIDGHKSLYKAGILHRDISVNNLMINEGEEDPYRFSFLIDLDLAIRTNRAHTSGTREMAGTRPFMAIGALQGHTHTYIYDLESFFWVLFWICTHYEGSREIDQPYFKKWSFVDANELIDYKRATVTKQAFEEKVWEYFTPYYRPLIPCMLRLHKVVFPDGGTWETDDITLYENMGRILDDEAQALLARLQKEEIVGSLSCSGRSSDISS